MDLKASSRLYSPFVPSIEPKEIALPGTRSREAQRESMRAKIIDSAVEVFTEKGVGRVVIDDIAERAGITRLTFYLHFQSKADVISELVRQGDANFEGSFTNLAPAAETGRFDVTHAWLLGILNKWSDLADVARVVHEAADLDADLKGLLLARFDQHVTDLATAIRVGARDLSESDAEIYAKTLLSPLWHYFDRYLRREPMDEVRVASIIAATWTTVIQQARG